VKERCSRVGRCIEKQFSIVGALSDAGYEVSTDYREGMKFVLKFSPDAVVLGANPPQLDCCDLLSEIKGSERTQSIRVVMLSPGGSAERTRGLDLGADDVLSLPFDAHELLSRVSWQLRNRHALRNFGSRPIRSKRTANAAQQVVAAVSEEQRTLRVGRIVALAIVGVAAVAFLIFYHRTQQQNTHVYAAITRLQTGALTEQELIDRSRRVLEHVQNDPPSPRDPEELRLQKQSQDLRSQIASSGTPDISALQNQLKRGGRALAAA
jgi:DNA-binding response OmpR family regulator